MFLRRLVPLAMGAAALSGAAPASGATWTLRLAGPERVGQHERVEFVIGGDRGYANPYDPSEVEVNLEVTTPSNGRLVVPAFFAQGYEWQYLDRGGRKAEWMYPDGPAGWRARFAPEEAGAHTATVVVRDRVGTRRSNPITFTSEAKPGKGTIRVSPRDPHFFEFSDGKPFFPIGQNVAFIGESQYLDTEKAAEVFRKMAEHGANFARVWACAEDWGLAIEARKSAWGRSWEHRLPFGPIPGADAGDRRLCVQLGGTNAPSANVAPSHPVALRPGKVYRLAGRVRSETDTGLLLELRRSSLGETVRSVGPDAWVDFRRDFTNGPSQWWLGELRVRTVGPGRVWIRHLSLQEVGGGPELLWEADPNRPARGVYNQPDCFLLDRLVAAAERHGIHLQLCLLTRDLYRPALRDPHSPEYQRALDDAKKFFRHAVARWGASANVLAWEYFNEMDPGAPTERFYRELGEYLARTDPYGHLRATSAWSPAPRDWAHPQLDIADLHWYLRPVSQPSWKDEVAAVLDRAKLLRGAAPAKPALLGEFGLADDKWGRSPYMPQDTEGVHFHNALWASAFSGLSGTAMFWWWETLDQNNLYRHYRPLASFLADLPFCAEPLQAVVLTTEKQSRALAWLGKNQVHLWIHHPQATWWNFVAEKKTVPEVREDGITFDALEPGNYSIQWWDTQTGRIRSQEQLLTEEPVLRVSVPAYTSDIAGRIVPR